jgi:predicted nucleic acid-binding protein
MTSTVIDSSVLVAALASGELKHAECLALLLKGGNCIYSHALLETFSTLTGAKLGVRVTADFAARIHDQKE